jgi:hypothetical protein
MAASPAVLPYQELALAAGDQVFTKAIRRNRPVGWLVGLLVCQLAISSKSGEVV